VKTRVLIIHLWWFHVENFSDSTLHDQEMRIVDVQLDGSEKVVNPIILDIRSVEQVLVLAANDNLES
jgi:hypothetical protein